MAGSCPKHWSNKPDWLTASHEARCQTPQLYFQAHCHIATHCPSSPGSTLSSGVVTRPTTQLVVEASSRSPQQAIAGPDSRRQQTSTRWRVERCCQTRSFWSDVTVHAELATTTTTSIKRPEVRLRVLPISVAERVTALACDVTKYNMYIP